MNNVLITPSYRADFERCRELVDSIKRYVSGYSCHYLLVDRADTALFASLRCDRVQLITKQELLPYHQLRFLGQGKWWVSSSLRPVRGWILQQLSKLAITEQLDADAFVYVDSDLQFIRPYDVNTLWQAGDLRFSVKPRAPMMYQNRRYRHWYASAAALLGVGDPALLGGAYIAQLNAFKRDTCHAMLALMSENTERTWLQALSQRWDFSEFILYGVFVDEVLGQSGHWYDEHDLCHSSWFYTITDQASLKTYLDQLQAHHVAVHIQSNLGFSLNEYQSLVRAISV